MSPGLTHSTIFAQTKNRNHYLFDRKLKKTFITHPLLNYICQLSKDEKSLETWLNSLEADNNRIEDIGVFSKEEIQYYYEKYLFLKNSGFFSPVAQEEMVSGKVTPEQLRITLANLKQVTFEITERCNLICDYCGYGKFYNNYDPRSGKDLDIETAKQVIDYVKKYLESPLNTSLKNKTYIGFYGGEPLLNFPFVRELVGFVNSQQWTRNFFIFSMTTNGLLLDKYMDFLATNNVSLLISLDGNEANNTYRKFKNGAPSFEKIVRNVGLLKHKYPDYFDRSVNFNAVLHNKNSVSDIYAFFLERYAKKPGIGALNTSGIREEQKRTFWETYSNINESLFNSEDYSQIEKEMFINLPNIQDVSSFIHTANDHCFEDYSDLLHAPLNHTRFPTGTCMPFSKKMFITVSGKILACERIGQTIPLGQAGKEGVEIDLERVSQRYNGWLSHIKKQCASCYHYEQCAQCLYYLDIESGKPFCANKVNETQYSTYVSAILNKLENSPGLYNRIINEVVME
jgi:uncharacterized protein